MQKFFLFLVLACSQIYAAKDDQEMVVKLATEQKLMPLYLSVFTKDNAGLDDAYIQKLRAIMAFDLGLNGYTDLVKNTPALDQYLNSLPFDYFGDLQKWKSAGISYVVKVRVQNKELDVRVMSIQGGMVRGVDDLPLNGDLAADRRQVHRLSDAAHRLLFGEEGIASTRILFTKKTGDGLKGKWASEVWEMDYDGGNARQVTHDRAYAVTPIYAPPAPGQKPTQFYYVSYLTGQPKIYVASLKNGLGTRFSTLKGNQLLPAVSKKHDQVAFISDYTGNPDLFVQPINKETRQAEKPFQVFAHFRATQGSPTFSPDGSKVAFVSDKDGSPKIYVIDIPTPGTLMSKIKATLLTKYQRSSTSPNWSPDGSKLVFSALTHGVRQIWMYDFNKKEEVQLTTGPDHKENPSFGPNNLHIAYNTVNQTGSDIYVMNVNQLKSMKVSSGGGEQRFPNWEPR